MREIKFRAWDDGVMYPRVTVGGEPETLLTYFYDEELHPYASQSQRNEKEKRRKDSLGFGWRSLSEGAIPMQCTGLKDSNGVEVYEGDIVRIKNNHGYFIKKPVVWNNGNRWQGFRVGKGDREIEVIGNIYENPELLEAEL